MIQAISQVQLYKNYTLVKRYHRRKNTAITHKTNESPCVPAHGWKTKVVKICPPSVLVYIKYNSLCMC
jgi:hypothetical protein